MLNSSARTSPSLAHGDTVASSVRRRRTGALKSGARAGAMRYESGPEAPYDSGPRAATACPLKGSSSRQTEPLEQRPHPGGDVASALWPVAAKRRARERIGGKAQFQAEAMNEILTPGMRPLIPERRPAFLAQKR